jgi:hypothetical protein
MAGIAHAQPLAACAIKPQQGGIDFYAFLVF